jgi:hypothetical protein
MRSSQSQAVLCAELYSTVQYQRLSVTIVIIPVSFTTRANCPKKSCKKDEDDFISWNSENTVGLSRFIVGASYPGRGKMEMGEGEGDQTEYWSNSNTSYLNFSSVPQYMSISISISINIRSGINSTSSLALELHYQS